MNSYNFTREQLCFLLYALVATKDNIHPSEHYKIDELIKILNK
jgi:hypothetical protein